ncbi:MAG: hypothetical protein K9J16_17455, partial [Melioribacteraceae bacterium]|nr:hypothetical protein [Melioribacteraceae bacterium]MCF8356641.1 hypothetical protein [Melioribacteraceae bacterium]MCF8396025.1 hypothetical protein [Melioribacteraceae bacterium]MCF8421050.1 hypothetical protein [Melioribacteraceae bacterium]
MKQKLIAVIYLTAILLISVLLISANDDDNRITKTYTNDDYNYIAINEIFMWVSNNGDGSHDPRTDASGFYWPGGIHSRLPAIFNDGLVW